MNPIGSANGVNVPDHLYVELTNRCNLRCTHCYLSAGPGRTDVLHTDLIKRALREFADLGGYSVALSGGEPLLHPDWAAILSEATSMNLSVTVVTNGILLTARTIDTLVEHHATIAVSVDGLNAETHDAIRGAGSFEKLRLSLHNLVLAGAQKQVVVCFTPNHLNIDELGGLARELNREGFQYLYLSLLEDRGRQHSTSLGALAHNDRVQLLLSLVFLLTNSVGTLHVETGHLRYFFQRLLGDWEPLGDPMEKTLRITPRGDVFMTAYVDDSRFKLGELREGTLIKFWGSNRSREIMAAAEQRFLSLSACHSCPYWIVCGGGSPARAFAMHGSFSQPDDFCQAKYSFLESWFKA